MEKNLNHLAVPLKLTQYHKSTIVQFFRYSKTIRKYLILVTHRFAFHSRLATLKALSVYTKFKKMNMLKITDSKFLAVEKNVTLRERGKTRFYLCYCFGIIDINLNVLCLYSYNAFCFEMSL